MIDSRILSLISCLGIHMTAAQNQDLTDIGNELAASEEARKRAEEFNQTLVDANEEYIARAEKAEAELAKLREQEPVITSEMVEAYLIANQKYWEEVDKLPDSPVKKWRQGTPHEATKVSLIAALSVAAPVPPADVAEWNGGKVRYMRPNSHKWNSAEWAAFGAMADECRNSMLYEKGDAILVWVHEGDIIANGELIDAPQPTAKPCQCKVTNLDGLCVECGKEVAQ